MGFPVGYTEVLLPKLLFNTLSVLGFIRHLILTFLRLLGLSDFLEPDIVWPDPDPSSATTSSSHFHHHHHHYYSYSSSPLTLHNHSLPLPSVSASLIREMLPAVIKFAEVESKNNGSDTDSPERCAVCLYDFEGEEEIRRLSNCRHMFHRLCLDRWMDCDRRTCPLCRTPFVPDELQDAFNQKLWAAAEEEDADVDVDGEVDIDVDGSVAVISAAPGGGGVDAVVV